MQIERIEPACRDFILAMARANAKATKRTLAVVARDAHGEPTFFEELAKQEKRERGKSERTGRRGSVTLRKFDELTAYFMHPGNWPDGEVPEIKFPLRAEGDEHPQHGDQGGG